MKRYQHFREIWRVRVQNFYKTARFTSQKSVLFFERHFSKFLLNTTEINCVVEKRQYSVHSREGSESECNRLYSSSSRCSVACCKENKILNVRGEHLKHVFTREIVTCLGGLLIQTQAF